MRAVDPSHCSSCALAACGLLADPGAKIWSVSSPARHGDGVSAQRALSGTWCFGNTPTEIGRISTLARAEGQRAAAHRAPAPPRRTAPATCKRTRFAVCTRRPQSAHACSVLVSRQSYSLVTCPAFARPSAHNCDPPSFGGLCKPLDRHGRVSCRTSLGGTGLSVSLRRAPCARPRYACGTECYGERGLSPPRAGLAGRGARKRAARPGQQSGHQLAAEPAHRGH